MSAQGRLEQKKGINAAQDFIENEREVRPKPFVSWRTLTFFKNSGLMIRFEPAKQLVYISFILKTTQTHYQPFKDGFVVKLTLFDLNELLFCLTHSPPQAWDTWREKKGQKYQVKVYPFPLQQFQLTSKTRVNQTATALKLTVFNNGKTTHQFVLSPHEMWLVTDLLSLFRQAVIQGFVSNNPLAVDEYNLTNNQL